MTLLYGDTRAMDTPEIESNAIVSPTGVPCHVAIIMDGNGRWARLRHLPRHAGHRAGVQAVRAVVEQSVRRGVKILTLFAFSSENWARPPQEVRLLMALFRTVLRREIELLQRNDVRLRVIGERTAFSERLQQRIAEAEQVTAGNNSLLLQIAANYGGRWDLTQAARCLAREVRVGRLDPDTITEGTFAAALSFADQPDPDLFIRTGGERRVSNFLLWQAAYAELYFSDLLWPDFDGVAFDAALLDYGRRQRRFGKTGDQVTQLDARPRPLSI